MWRYDTCRDGVAHHVDSSPHLHQNDRHRMGADSTSAAPPASLDVLAHAVVGAAGVKAGVAEMRATLQLPAKQQADLVLPT
jgi:hypothetical protein